MNRRDWLQTSTLLAAGATFGAVQTMAAPAEGQGDAKSLIVLVHGGFH